MLLKDGTKKMSKSIRPTPSAINRSIRRTTSAKIKRAALVAAVFVFEQDRRVWKVAQRLQTLVGIYAVLAGMKVANSRCSTSSGCSVQPRSPTSLSPSLDRRTGMRRLMNDPGEVDRVLKQGGSG